MKRKINIYKANNVNVLDAKELYNSLNIGRDFPTWIRAKIKAAGLVEIEDYTLTVVNRKSAGRPEIHYELTIPAAIKMVESMRVNTDTENILDLLSSIDSIEATATKITRRAVKTVENKKTKKTCNVGKEKNVELDQAGITTFVHTNDVFGKIRFVKINGKELAVGRDVAIALGYSNPRDAIKRHCKGVVKHDGCKEKGQMVALLSEGDIYRLITNSQLPSAEKFESWVFDDVLPAIRKHGMYVTEATVDKMLNDPDQAIKMLEQYKIEKQQKEALLKEKLENEPKVMAYEEFINSDGLYTFSETAKILSIPLTATSDNIVGKNTFLAWLRRDGILISNGDERNTPYQRFVNQGYFELKAYDCNRNSNKTAVRVTPRGIEWLYKKYRYPNMPKKIEIPASEEDYDIAL